MEDKSWVYRETLIRCHTLLVEEYTIQPKVHELANRLFEQDHITFTDRQDVQETQLTTGKMHLLICILIKQQPFAIKAAYKCLLQQLTENGYHGIVTKLQETLNDMNKSPKPPEQDLLREVVNFRDNIMDKSSREIQRCFNDVAMYLTPTQVTQRTQRGTSQSHAPNVRLLKACEEGDVETVKEIIKQCPECINTVNDKGESALMFSCSNASVRIVKTLLTCDTINANLHDTNGHTALIRSVLRGDTDVLSEMLQSSMVDPSETDNNGLSFLLYLFGCDIPLYLLALTLMLQHSGTIIDEWNVLEIDTLMYIGNIKQRKKDIQWNNVFTVVKCLLTQNNVNHTDVLKLCLTVCPSSLVEQILELKTVEISKDIQDYGYSVLSINPEILHVLRKFGLVNLSTLSTVQIDAIMESVIRHNDIDLCGSTHGLLDNWEVNEALKTVLFIQSMSPGILPKMMKAKMCDLNTLDPAGNSVFAILCKYGRYETVCILLDEADIDFSLQNKNGQTCFMVALMNSDKSIPKLLWDKDMVNVNHCDTYNTSTLSYACVSCNDKIVSAMLLCSAININIKDNMGYTALSYLCLSGMYLISTQLLNLSFFPKLMDTLTTSDAAGKGKNTAAMYIDIPLSYYDPTEFANREAVLLLHKIPLLTSVISKCVKGSNTDIALMLLNHQDVRLTVPDNGNNTLLMLASLSRDYILVSQLLESKVIDVHAVNSVGHTALCNAIMGNNTRVVELLMTHNVNAINPHCMGVTPLALSCVLNNVEMATLLIQQGAQVNAVDKDGDTPLLIACQAGGDNNKIVDALIEANADINQANFIGTTPLTIAIQNNNVKLVDKLVNNKAEVNVCDAYGDTPLTLACIYMNIAIIDILIGANADVNVAGSKGVTPLMMACKKNNAVCVNIFLRKNADVHVCDKKGNTPLIYACRIDNGDSTIVDALLAANADVNKANLKSVTPLTAACEINNVEIVEKLIHYNAEVNVCNEDGNTPLILACRNTNIVMFDLLIEANADVNVANLEGVTPLMVACEKNNLKMVNMCLCNKAGVNMYDEEGNTPLLYSCKVDIISSKIVDALIKANADVNMVNLQGISPIMAVCWNNDVTIVRKLVRNKVDVNACNVYGYSPLLVACTNNSDNKIADVLIEANADVNKANLEGVTPLMAACDTNNVKIVEKLVCNKADVNMGDKNGDTPLLYACVIEEGPQLAKHPYSTLVKNSNVDTVELLIGAKADVNQANHHGMTPIMMACKYCDIKTVQLLLDNNTDVNVADTGGNTPLLYACGLEAKKVHVKLIQLLVQANADVNVKNLQGKSPLMLVRDGGHGDIAEFLVNVNYVEQA